MSNSENKALVDYDALLRKEAETIRDAIAQPAGNVISCKGKLFTLPDGTSHPGPMRVVILDFVNYNSYFPGTYDPANIVPPDCFAIGKNIKEMAPSENSPKQQHSDCATCPRNQWKSAPNGKGKACKNTVRLAIAKPNATKDDIPMLVTVSPTGLTPFANFIGEVAREFNAPPVRVTAEISFNSALPYPSLIFGDPKLHDNMEVMMHLREKAQDMLMREPDVSKAA